MAIAVFGTKIFEITDSKLYTFSGFQYGASLDTEKQDADGKKPSTYNKGPTLSNFGFSIKLSADNGVNPRTEFENWESIMAAGVAYPFVLGKRPIGVNKWLLVDVQASEEVIDAFGNMLSLKIDLKFDEYVRPGTASESSSGLKNSSPGVKTAVSIQPASYSADKSSLKRDNTAMSRDVFNSFKEA